MRRLFNTVVKGKNIESSEYRREMTAETTGSTDAQAWPWLGSFHADDALRSVI